MIMTAPENVEHAVYLPPPPSPPPNTHTLNPYTNQLTIFLDNNIHVHVYMYPKVSVYAWSARANTKSSAIPMYEGQ